MRILVELSARLGEVVCDVALLRTILAGMPDCHLEVVCRKEMSGVIEDCHFIRRRNMLASGDIVGFLGTNLRSGVGKWQAFIQAADDSSLELAQLLMDVPFSRGPEHRDGACKPDGMLMHRLSVLEGLVPAWRDKVATEIPLMEGRLSHAMSVVGFEEGDRVMTVAPGSSTGNTPWPREKSREVVSELGRDFDKILVLGRIADRSHCFWLADEVKGKAIAGELPLPYALALFTMAGLHVGTDNCMAQAAAAFGVPTVCVGGPADCYTKPLGQQMIPGTPGEIKAGVVIGAARRMLAA